jgi:hypothetical protein
MNRYSNIIFLTIVFAVLFSGAAICSAETQIHLKDGRMIKVENFWREGGMVKYESFGGVIGIPMADVERIVTPDMEVFEDAKKADTVEAYENFIRDYSKSEFVPQGEQRIKELQFEEVKRINSAPVYLDYIRRNPNSIFLQEAKETAETLIFQDAFRVGGLEKFQEYLGIYPEGKYALAVGKAIEEKKFEAMKESQSVSEMEAYLKEFPESPYRLALEDRMAELIAESGIRSKAKSEKQKKARELQELQAKEKHRRMVLLFSVLGVLVFSAGGIFVFLRMKKSASPAHPDLRPVENESVGEAAPSPAFSTGPVRYEDLIGAPRKDDTLMLPDMETGAIKDPDAPIFLPEPAKKAEASSEAGSSEEKSDDTIILGDGTEGSAAEPPASENKSDLPDQKADFKLELGDGPKESNKKSSTGSSPDDEVDPPGGDFPSMIDDEDTVKRRGGGQD